MIIDTIDNRKRYRSFPALLKRGLALAGRLKDDIPVGVTHYPGGIKVMVSVYATKLRDDCLFESHRKFIDIQLLLKGKEVIRWAPVKGMSVACRYDPKKDITIYKYPGESIPLSMKRGVFAVFFPEDAHNPGLAFRSASCRIKKIVVKVPV
jgi:biofilm protein TabA